MKHKLIFSVAFFTALLLFAAQTLPAQNTKIITLKEAIDLGITNSFLLKKNTAQIQEAVAAKQEAQERKLPDFSISGSYLYIPVKPTVHIKPDTGKGGGPNVSQAMYGIANISLPIYTGGKIKYGIEAAGYLEQAIRLDGEDNKQTVIFNTIDAFSELYKANAIVSIVKENLEQSHQRVKDLSSLEKNGLLARNDLLKAELQSSNIELSLLDAENNYKIASVNMALMIGLPEQTLLMADTNSIQQSLQIKTLDDYETMAMVERKDLNAIELRKKVAALAIKIVNANYYPGIALTAGYVAANIPGFLSITNAINLGVGVKYEVSSLWKTKAKIAQTQARVAQITASQQMLSNNIRLQINRAYQYYLLSNKKIQVYQKAVEQAMENYRITKNKYNNTLATTTDLLDADVAQLQTKLNLTNAIADALVAYNKLLLTAGNLTNN